MINANVNMFEGFIKVKNKRNKINDIKLPWVEKYRPVNSSEILLDPFIKLSYELPFLAAGEILEDTKLAVSRIQSAI